MTEPESTAPGPRPDGTYDVVISGASLAGCAAAILLARRGARVALLERRSDPDAYKVLCTHALTACAHPVLDELGLLPDLEKAGAVRNEARWYTRWGWIEPRAAPGGPELPYAYNVRRSTLDPLIRSHAARTPGVDLLLGHKSPDCSGTPDAPPASASRGPTGNGNCPPVWSSAPTARTRPSRSSPASPNGVTRTGGSATSPTSATCRCPAGSARRGSSNPTWRTPSPPTTESPSSPSSRTRSTCRPSARTWRAASTPSSAPCPRRPPIDSARRVSKFIGTVDYPLITRDPTAPGIALVGDAALTGDPLWGVGCGWALQTAQWLAEAVAPAATGRGDLDRALAAYGRTHRRRLRPHQQLAVDYARSRPFNPGERLMFSAAARDAAAARHMYLFASRLIGPLGFLNPRSVARAAAVNLRHRLRGPAPADAPAAGRPAR